ncbi:MAG: ATP-binding cassette domain-containing protein [Sciscionella sp.]
MQRPRIEVVGLGKSYDQQGARTKVHALVDVSLQAKAGTVLGVLGHNGAGKTTLINILATRTSPSSGTAKVCGWDVVRHGDNVRRHIGMTGQFVAVDDAMSGHNNLVLIARLLGANARQAKARAQHLIEMFDLADAAGRRASTYSGGMRRRLDLAASLIASPEVLFLDEPTTGLDPVSRTEVWGFVEGLAAGGTTVVLTTQYLEEADHLANEVVVLAAGRLVAAGTPEQLKMGVGKRTATVHVADTPTMLDGGTALRLAGMHPIPHDQDSTLVVPVSGQGDIATMVRTLDAVDIEILDMTVTEPTLNDVYLSLHNASWQPS